MAALTRARSKNDHKHISEILLSSHETEEHQWLYGDIPSDTYHSLNRLSKFLGLETEEAAKQWFESAQFKPIFDALYHKVIEPRILVSPGKQGPQFTAVQNAITMGEGHGNRKYTGWRMDESGFDDIDHYALCLIRLREENKHSHGGIFRNKQMTDQQIEQRLWHAIMRETSQRSKLRKRASGEASRQYNKKKQKKSHQQPLPPAAVNQQAVRAYLLALRSVRYARGTHNLSSVKIARERIQNYKSVIADSSAYILVTGLSKQIDKVNKEAHTAKK